MASGVNHTHEHQVVVSEEYYQTNDTNLRDEMMEEYAEKAPPPQKVPFYKKKKYWVICAILTVIITIVAVILALFVIFPAIAQSLMNKSKIDVSKAQIMFKKPVELENAVYSENMVDDMNSTFYMHMESALSNTGPFHATVKFLNPVNVHAENGYIGDLYFFTETEIAGGSGTLNAYTPFIIRDNAAFTTFAASMMAVEEFKWTLKGKLEITALSRTATVDLDKEILLKGMHGFPNVKITSFQLPSDAPTGGIALELGTMLESPSPIGVELGTIALQISYDNIVLGQVTGENVVLQQGENNLLLKGVLTPPVGNDTVALGKISTLFSDYIAGKDSLTTAVGISAAPDGINPIQWLSDGFKTVKLNVLLGNGSPLNIITGVSMGYLDLKFNSDSPYSPTVNAPLVNVGFKMPFGFSLDITEVTQSITLGLGNTKESMVNFAKIETPYTPSTSDQAAGKIELALNDATIAGIPGQESVFNDYTYDLTANGPYTFMLAGVASTKTNTPLGPLVLSGINFTVPTNLHGLEFLASSPTIINSLDVVDGTSDHLELAIDVTMENPSDFSISLGDVSFDMGADGTNLGVVTIKDLSLQRGSNQVKTTSTFDPRSSETGQNLLSSFVMGVDNDVEITGFSKSTSIASLAGGLADVKLTPSLPGLKSPLIQYAALTVLDSTLQDGVVSVKVAIANPFSAGISISKVVSAATFHGFPIGNIDQDISSHPFNVPGKSTAESDALSMSMNIDPASIALLLRTLALQSGMDTRALDAMLSLGGFNVGQDPVDATPDLFRNFDLVGYVKQAMGALQVDLALTSGLAIGRYNNDLAFSQGAVPIRTDDTVAKLIPIVGQPIVQMIVDGAVLAFDTIVLSKPTETNFVVQMKGSIANSGPMDAVISFKSPLNIAWNGKTLGTVTMPDITAVGGVGATFDVSGNFVVADVATMGEFAGYLINSVDFEWEITTNDVSVTALGFTFNKISLHKFVTLLGANGFKDAVRITEFNLPADHADGGIALVAKTEITNPSQIGFALSGAEFSNNFGPNDVYLGPLASDGPAVFLPKATSSMVMNGRMVHQTTVEGLTAVGTVFASYLGGHDTPLTVKGVSGSGEAGRVSWLVAAFETIRIENVILPAPAETPVLIPAIDLKEMTIDFTQDPWNPPTSSNHIEATLKNPFGFPLSVSELDMKVNATYHGMTAAILNVPKNAATTSPEGIITTSFQNVPFEVQNREVFAGFVQLLTLSESVTFNLQGESNALTSSGVGNLPLPANFNVDTTLMGLNNFGGNAQVLTTKVTGATSEYLIIDLTVQLSNPSTLTVNVGNINFNVHIKEGDYFVGRVYMDNTVITPGTAVYNGRMHLGGEGTDPAIINHMVTGYLTKQTVELIIKGSGESTTIPSLNPALQGVQLGSSITGLDPQLVTRISANVGSGAGGMDDLLLNGIVKVNVELFNPLDTPFTLTKVNADVTQFARCGPHRGYDVPVGSITNLVLDPPLTVPARSSAIAHNWPVKIFENTDDSLFYVMTLMIDPEGRYDLVQTVDNTVNGAYEIKDMQYNQNGVPYELVVEGVPVEDGMCELFNSFYPDPYPPGGSPPSGFSAASMSRTAGTASTDIPSGLQELMDKIRGIQQGSQPVVSDTPVVSAAPVVTAVPEAVPVVAAY